MSISYIYKQKEEDKRESPICPEQ